MSLREILAGSPRFAGVEPGVLESIAGACVERSYADGQLVAAEGEHGDEMVVIVSGSIRVHRKSADGREIDLATLGPGDLAGLLALVDLAPRRASCSARGSATVGVLTKTAFDQLCERDAALACALRLAVARQLVRDARALNDALRDAVEGSP